MRVVLSGVDAWRHELAGCLHACAGALLGFHGIQPLEALGAAWAFHYRPGDARPEEYYFPCRPGWSLLRSLAPYHPVDSTWHRPAGDAEGWEAVRAAVASGRPGAVAVDNFHLPFRPAYRDVHSNHLVLVYGFDDERRLAWVLDAVPPRFDGPIGLQQLARARGSPNAPAHARDMFFAGSEIARRWLDVEVGPPDAAPRLDRPTVARVLGENLRGFRAIAAGDAHEGLDGQDRFLRDAAGRLAGSTVAADELFVVAGAVLASTALHADWLALAARALELPALAELGRRVERIAHHWCAIRIMVALARSRQLAVERLDRRFSALRGDHEAALVELERCLAEV
ncbi:MAG TPA: BtrH N-terminal domain-containing protein [Candidatus Dormibacteraeota bacterium]|nr:BtrH N-terminal domain-containing protein [Candidatus Dormibacteraeota bacterium]